jgi:hypothetical protein
MCHDWCLERETPKEQAAALGRLVMRKAAHMDGTNWGGHCSTGMVTFEPTEVARVAPVFIPVHSTRKMSFEQREQLRDTTHAAVRQNLEGQSGLGLPVDECNSLTVFRVGSNLKVSGYGINGNIKVRAPPYYLAGRGERQRRCGSGERQRRSGLCVSYMEGCVATAVDEPRVLHRVAVQGPDHCQPREHRLPRETNSVGLVW